MYVVFCGCVVGCYGVVSLMEMSDMGSLLNNSFGTNVKYQHKLLIPVLNHSEPLHVCMYEGI